MESKASLSARYNRKRRATERLARTAIFASAALTVAVLVFIVGFILYRGFYSEAERIGEVSSKAEASFDGWKLAVNKKLRVSELSANEAFDAFSGEHIDWGKLSAQDFDMVPLVYPAGPQRQAELDALGVGEAAVSPMAVEAADPEAALALVAATPGAVALVPADAKLPGGVKSVPFRRIVFAVNPSVSLMENNRALKLLPESRIAEILSGKVKNWKEAGGRDEAVTIVPPGPGQTAAIAATPGAAGEAYWKDAAAAKIPLLKSKRVERGANLTPAFFYEAPKMSGRVGGVSTIIFNTLVMIFLTLAIATPIGVFAAIYLVEYARQGPLVRLLRLGTETLAGIPSIIFGLFGMLFFVNILGWGIGLISGVLTLTIMIMPTIVRTSEEALKTVPPSLREGSLALGASKLQTTLRVVVPAASPGILTGVILAIGRAVGETAALIFTMGSSYDQARSLFSSARVLSVHVYLIVAEGISLDRAFAAATILVFIIFAVNLATTKLIGRFNGMAGK